jgi:nitronate monooxygenase
MGTVFLACHESGAHPLHREAILSGRAGHTALTQGFTGRLARGADNELLQMLNKPGTKILPYPLQRGLMRSLALPAQKAGRSDLLALWAGQSANLTHCTRVTELLQSLVEGAAKRLNSQHEGTEQNNESLTRSTRTSKNRF